MRKQQIALEQLQISGLNPQARQFAKAGVESVDWLTPFNQFFHKSAAVCYPLPGGTSQPDRPAFAHYLFEYFQTQTIIEFDHI
jgi:hypothetical protein